MKVINENPATRRFYDDAVMGDAYDPPGPEWYLSDDGSYRYADLQEPVAAELAASDHFPTIHAASDAGADVDVDSDADSGTDTDTE